MTGKMIYFGTLIWIVTELQMISSITVSPDLGLRNVTSSSSNIKNIISTLTSNNNSSRLLNTNYSNKTTIKLKSNIPPDRNRRLIPYMTFYLPTNEYPTKQQHEIDSNHEQNSEKNQAPHKHPALAIYQPSSPTPLTHHQQYHQESLMDLNRLPPQYHQHQYHHNNAPSFLRLPIHNVNLNKHNHPQQYVMPPTSEGNYHAALTQHKILFNQYKGGNNEYIGVPSGNGDNINHSQNGHLRNQFYHNQHLENENKEGRIVLKESNLHKTKQQYNELNKAHPLILIGNTNPIEAFRIQNPKQQMAYSIFKESNKIPGHFTPIIFNPNNNQIGNNENNQNLQHNNKQNDAKNNLNEGEIHKQNNQHDDRQLHKHNLNVIHNQYSEQAQNQVQEQEQEKHNEQQQYYQYQEVINSNPQEQQEIKNTNNNEPENTKIISSPGVQQLQTNQNHIGIVQNVIVSSTQRPQYHSNQEQLDQHHIYEEQQSLHPKLTPQQRYVAYLQHQFKQNHHDHHDYYHSQDNKNSHNNQQINQNELKNYNQDLYLIQPSPSSIPENNINYVDNTQKPQKNQDFERHQHHPQYIYTPDISSAPEKITDEKDLILIQPQHELLRPHVTMQSHRHYDRIPSPGKPNGPIQNPNLNYAQYLQRPSENPEDIYHQPRPASQEANEHTVPIQHQTPSTPGKNTFKPVAFVTTPQPILVTSIGPFYKKQPVQRLHPISTSQPQSTVDNFSERIPQKIHLISSTPTPSQIFLIKPSTDIPVQHVHQHLTETVTPRARPARPLSRYHSRYHKFQPSPPPSTISTPLKLTPSQKYEPFDVTQSIRTNVGTSTMAPPSLPTRYSKNYPQLKHHPQAQPTEMEQKLSDNYQNPSYPDIKSSSLAEILRKLQESNHLPQTITADNIDNSIKTLIKILNNLKESQTIVENPSQYHEPPEIGNTNSNDDDYSDTPVETPDPSHRGPNSGRPGIDYPALSEIPVTKFSCKEQRYKGFFGDPETNCQVWHYCDLNGGQASFLCPNGTIFSQVALTCDWWFNVKCSSTAQLYVLNERLYKYILPFTPKFPEDYSGPLVDKYLALKFKEMEEKMSKEKLKGREQMESDGDGNKISESESETENNASKDKTESSTERVHNNEQYENDNSDSDNDEIKSVNLEDVENNRGSVDSGLPYNTEYVKQKLRPIIVSTTLVPSTLTTQSLQESQSDIENSSEQYYSSTSSTTRQPKHHGLRNTASRDSKRVQVEVESEKVEVIEIKTDGSTGHLIPPHGAEY